jgi:hypothetical protein
MLRVQISHDKGLIMTSSDDALLQALKSGDEKGVFAALKDGATAHRHVCGELGHVYRDDVPLIVLAAWTGIPNIVKALLDAGAHLDSECVDWKTPPTSDDDMPFYGPSALGVACKKGHEAVVELLLGLGARVSKEDVYYTLEGGNPAILELLIETDEDFMRGDNDYSRSPLGRALADGRLDLVEILDAAGAKLRGIGEVERLRRELKGKAKAWVSSRSNRALVGKGTTWWVALVSPSELDSFYAELLGNWRDETLEWGAKINEEEDKEWNFGVPYNTKRRRITRLLGTQEVTRVDSWKKAKAPGRKVLGHRVFLQVDGVLTLLWEEPDRFALLCASGDEDRLNLVDRRLQSMTLSVALRKAEDDDSEYAVRKRLRLVQIDKDAFHRLRTAFDVFDGARSHHEELEIQVQETPQAIPTRVIADCHRALDAASEKLSAVLDEKGLRQTPFDDLLLPKRMKGGKRRYRNLIKWLTAGGHQSDPLVPCPMTDRHESLLRELLSPELVDEWGFGLKLRAASHTERRMPRIKDRACLYSNDSHIPYFSGSFVVDFSKEEVRLNAIDQKTPAEKHWQLQPSSGWWQRALMCDWPIVNP